MTLDKSNWLAERFEENRTHLRAVAYRMLGSLSETDDAVARTVPWVVGAAVHFNRHVWTRPSNWRRSENY